MLSLDELASRTLSHPLGHISLHANPMVIPLDVFIHLVQFGMHEDLRLMILNHNLFLKSPHVRDANPSMDQDRSILSRLILRLLVSSNPLKVLVQDLSLSNPGQKIGLVHCFQTQRFVLADQGI